MGEGHLLDWLLDRLGLFLNRLKRDLYWLFNNLDFGLGNNLLGWLGVNQQLNVELDLLVGGKSEGVGHLEVRVVCDSNLLIVRVDVTKVYLCILVDSGLLADVSGLLDELLEGLDVGDSFNDGVVVEVKGELDL